jgi:hypothetical protein
MSLPSSASPQPVAPVVKQATNIYTVMLLLAFAAIVTASVLLYVNLQQYGTYPWWNTGSVGVSPPR